MTDTSVDNSLHGECDLIPVLKNRLMELRSMSNPIPEKAEKITDSIKNVLSYETLLDILVSVFEDCKQASRITDSMQLFLNKYENIVKKIQTLRLNISDFEVVKPLAQGAIGKVSLVKGKYDKKYYALKTLSKNELLSQRETAFFMEERNAMTKLRTSKYTTSLYAAFQDRENLYLLMEYAPGGSLQRMLEAEGALTVEEARFYMAEVLLALEELHNLNFIHRDVKPGNILIYLNGHVKLVDFGSCISVNDNELVSSNVPVGTPDYISPEVLRANEGKVKYGKECDWWSYGISLYELLLLEPPFYSDSLLETYSQIMDHKNTFGWPDDCTLDDDTKDLITKLICDREVRLGKNGAKEIKEHKFFKGVDFENIYKMKPPFMPKLNNPEDTTYFMTEEDDDHTQRVANQRNAVANNKKDVMGFNLPFVGYSFNHNISIYTSFDFGNQGNTSTGNNSIKTRKVSVDFRALGSNESLDGQKNMSVIAMEEELKMLKFEVNKKNDLEKTKTRLEKEKIELEMQIIEVKNNLRAQQRSKYDLERQLSDAQEELAQAKKEKDSLMLSNKNFTEYEKKIEVLNMELKEKSAISEKNQEIIDEITKAKAVLELELEHNNKKIESGKLENEKLEKANIELKTNLENEIKKNNDKEMEIKQIFECNENLTKEVDKLKGLISDKENSESKLKEQNSVLEKEKAMIDVELNMLKKKELYLMEENEKAKANIEELKKGIAQTEKLNQNEEIINDLKSKIDNINEEYHNASKELSLLKIENTKISQNLDEANNAKTEAQNKYFNLNKQYQDSMNYIKTIEQTKQNLEKQNITAETELKKLKENMDQQNQQYSNFEKTISDLNHQQALMKIELDEAKVKMEKQQQVSSELENEISKNTNELREQETKNKELELSLLEKTNALENLKRENENSKQQYDELMQEKQQTEVEQSELNKKYQLLEIEFRDLKERYQNECDLRNSIEMQAQKFKEQSQMDIDNIEDLKEELIHIKADYENLKKEHEITNDKLVELNGKYEDVKRENEKFKLKIETSVPTVLEKEKGALSPINDSGASIYSENNHKKFKFFGFRKGRSDVDKTLMKSDTDDELRIYPLHNRKLSTTSYSNNNSKIELNVIFNPNEPLAGWLKVPKSQKSIKHGWDKRYAVVKDFKILFYENVKDSETNTNCKGVISLTCDIFNIQTVVSKELIHAQPKEIKCIFKIHSTNVGNDSQQSFKESNMNNISLNELQKTYNKLQTDIKTEENIYGGYEKMVSAYETDNDRKFVAVQQLEASKKRLNKLYNDFENVKSQIQKISPNDNTNNVNIVDVTDEHEITEEEINRVDLSEYKEELKATIESELKRKESIQRSIQQQQNINGKTYKPTKLIQELQTIDLNIESKKKDIEKIESGDEACKQLLKKKIAEQNQIHEFIGHKFRAKEFCSNITACDYCHDAFWGSLQAQECTVCKLACHKHCQNYLEKTCQEVMSLRNIKPKYLMAQDDHDKFKWIQGLEYFRNEYEKSKN
ncbi:hypothetical protein BCR36DRAFT_584701 [Piromyces finnis]|uniref:non-specific serine/threonine protein kinase n=1 Tax=Piromyces finnis TaxID=1754191 RepID=A0A1Y1V5B4_9FUNG|nr:hypothetical protein BCR36DRAFT_584701 [Piromyces finnis]|eukprot:ORX47610.1 hypothetical protein BCR36DRAFT_584701 [Piromyces finnis]